MGREWCRSRSLGKAKERRAVEKPPGCMKGILHLLHFRRSLLFSSLNLHHLDDRRTGGIERDSSPNGIRGVHGIYQSFASLLSESRDDNPKNDESQKEKVIPSDDSTDQQAETPRTSNVVACLMGLEALPLTSPAPVPSLRPSSLHNQKENDGEDRRRRGKVTNPAPPQTRRKPLTVRSTNIPDLKSSNSIGWPWRNSTASVKVNVPCGRGFTEKIKV
ncbi:unnamed protein product [Spirodela intermedia]|uniref:Uncharacterized protein n=1 Tax=Spirodela intermedia TaxID=51605 RepID=A0A7I8L177_SPIIN|nr:unnamed protein product [Spirodela intermedia]